MNWTDERVALIKKLWGDGKTAAEIAKELGGVTRNAVIGKAHRLKLSNRTSPIQPVKKIKIQAHNQNTPTEKRPPRKFVESALQVKGGVPLTELAAGQCRWPQGDPREAEFGFCGGPGVPGLPYCPEHAKIAYQAASRSRVLQAEDFEDRRSAEEIEAAEDAFRAAKKKAS